ncbi:hypothetical protein A3Q56_00072 [Intoshia linei]|uniref:ATP-binding cassette sub-family E member 1 n=1 Tax=Intoshia linei TaxID=1819745 RepID=A0A177BEY1_9BILA|nr:hypothetical protein A3Q56_00072 [Intoshia linei]
MKSVIEETRSSARIAIINLIKCKPKRCNLECKKCCPVNKVGKKCIEVEKTDKTSIISETMCIGCGLCVKRCPYKAIEIINLPSSLESDTTHRYGPNSFKLHRLPIPRRGEILGLVGINGIGKSTALKILGAKLKPNLGNFSDPPDWLAILKHYRGSELQNFFKAVLEDNIKTLIKPQYVDQIPRAVKGTVGELIKKKSEIPDYTHILKQLGLTKLMDRKISELSGGELQRFAIAIVCIQNADIYMFDEPSSYLDVSQRLNIAKVIRELVGNDKYIIVVEHDLAVLDYMSDFICCLYGKPGAYGVVTSPSSVHKGINIFLDGYVPTENVRFRQEKLIFNIAETATEDEIKRLRNTKYPTLQITLGSFKLSVESGAFTDSEIIVMLGENGTGKTTFIRLLAGRLKADDGNEDIPELRVSYKPQKISPKSTGTVRMLLHNKIRDAYVHPQFVSDVINPLNIEALYDQEVQNLSGGELQRIALTICLGKPADVYLIDEPSAYLDSEQRLYASKVIRRYIYVLILKIYKIDV